MLQGPHSNAAPVNRQYGFSSWQPPPSIFFHSFPLCFYPTTFRKACQGQISTQKRKVLKYAKRQLSGTFPGRHSLLKDRIAETPNPALAFQFQRNVGRIKSFTRFFSKNRRSGEGRALSQAVTSRTSEAVHSCCTCNEACAAHKICLKQTTAAGGIPPAAICGCTR